MSKSSSRAVILSLVVITCVASKSALAADSKAQLHLPWTLIDKQITSSLLAEDTSLTDVTPSLQLDAGGVTWNLTNLRIATHVPTNSVKVSPARAEIAGNNVPVTITVDQIAVDQIVDQTISGILVHIHVQGSCGPLKLIQTAAQVDALYALDWSSGSPQSALQTLTLAWAPNSWTLAPFTCQAPEGSADLLRQSILDRAQNADDFRPYVQAYLEKNSATALQSTLASLRQPFRVGVGLSHQTLNVGALIPTSTGVVADLTVSHQGALVTKPKQLPSSDVLRSLSTVEPSLLAGKEVLQQLINDEVAAQPSYKTIDLQTNDSFHSFMKDRFAQLFAWGDMLNYPSSAPFPLTVYRPKAPNFTVLENGQLQGTVNVQAVIQSYRDQKWWTFVNLTGSTQATVTVTVAKGTVSYATALDGTQIKSVYAPVYKETYDKSGNPPASKLSSAVDGVQSALSGSFTWPAVNLGAAGSYTVTGLKWISTSEFLLTWAKK